MTFSNQNSDSIRKSIENTYRKLEQKGLNQINSGNVSVRLTRASRPDVWPVKTDPKFEGQDQLLITPSGVSSDRLQADDIVQIGFDYQPQQIENELQPSTEWRIHRDILSCRPEVNAVIHTHSTFATAVAMTRSEIPACHYLVAAFGGNNIRCAPYARFGTEELSKYTVEALKDRMGCLLSNHGMVVVGQTLKQAFWFAVQLETLAKQYYHSRIFGNPVLLSHEQIEEARLAMKDYVIG